MMITGVFCNTNDFMNEINETNDTDKINNISDLKQALKVYDILQQQGVIIDEYCDNNKIMLENLENLDISINNIILDKKDMFDFYSKNSKDGN